MSGNLYEKIHEILDGRQLSISGITRELRDKGFNEHRLVLTGYLRALRDLDRLNEVEIPPSKVYTHVDNEELFEDIYSLIAIHLRNLDLDNRVPIGVFTMSALFKRPVFKYELSLVGSNQKHILKYMEMPNCIVRESRDKNLKEFRAEISKIEVPLSDPAYEIVGNDEHIVTLANEMLLEMLKDVVDISGLVPKTKQTKLSI
ncbi:MAG: hypothetical protein P1P69_00015 [Methanosarcinaceae archaeon]|nr:hypothetical protein [Methanosarcinaceae archaeon]MDF1532880.1 hypothetical protein [Methanosarcinaceae archaeon]